MNFARAKKDGLSFTQLAPIRLGGADGAIAKYVATQEALYARLRWTASAADILAVAAVDDGTDSILFINTGDPSTYYELECIVGITSDKDSEIVMNLKVFQGQRTSQSCIVSQSNPSEGNNLCESMLMTGGYDGGAWQWAPPAMEIGAAIVK